MNKIIKGKNVVISEGCHIGNNVILEDDVYIDYNCIIRDNVIIRKGTTIGANCIIGEYQQNWFGNHKNNEQPILTIGKNSIIRSYTIIYSGSTIGSDFQTGHRVTIRENTVIGDHCSIGTLSDIQGYCNIGNYVRCHSNVHIGQKSNIKDFVWIFPYVVLTNDPTPPSETMMGVTVEEFAVIATGTVVLPGITVKKDTLIAAGTILSKDFDEGRIVIGNPCKDIGSITKIKNKKTGEQVYPWRYSFDRGMPWQVIGYDEWEKSIKKSE